MDCNIAVHIVVIDSHRRYAGMIPAMRININGTILK
jgi:hypothetical protein